MSTKVLYAITCGNLMAAEAQYGASRQHLKNAIADYVVAVMLQVDPFEDSVLLVAEDTSLGNPIFLVKNGDYYRFRRDKFNTSLWAFEDPAGATFSAMELTQSLSFSQLRQFIVELHASVASWIKYRKNDEGHFKRFGDGLRTVNKLLKDVR